MDNQDNPDQSFSDLAQPIQPGVTSDQQPSQPVTPNQPTPSQPYTPPQPETPPMMGGQQQTQPQQPQTGQIPPGGTGTPPPVGEAIPAAPEGFQRAQPSAFETGPAGVAGQPVKRRRRLLPCFCVVFLVVFLLFGGLGTYAWYTDAEIPIISDIVRMIKERFRNPETEAANLQQMIADTTLGIFLPFMVNEEGIASVVAENALSEEYLQQMLEGMFESFRYDLDIDYQLSDENNFGLSMNGSMDYREEGNERFDTTFLANFKMDEEDEEVSGAIRFIGADSYIKIDSYPEKTHEGIVEFIGQDFDIRGMWIDISSDDVGTATTLFTTEETTEGIDDEDVRRLKDFITDEAVLKNAKLLDDEEIAGNKCSCVQMSYNQEELLEIYKKYYEIYEKEYDEEEVKKDIENINNVQVQGCVGKKTNQLHRFGIKIDGTDDDGEVSVDINMKMWDYGMDMGIMPPEDVKPFSDILDEIIPGYSTNARDQEVKSYIMNIQVDLENYYALNEEYPESLDELDLDETEFYGEDVHYDRSEDKQSYNMWIKLPGGELYEVGSY